MSNREPTRLMEAQVGATQQMPALGSAGDAFRTQMGGTATCPVCKATTPLSETYCGECGFLLSSAPGEEIPMPAETAPAAELVDTQEGRRYRLREGTNTLGRQGTDVLVNDGTVSRVHAAITIAGATITVEDLGSSNGTRINDQRIAPNQPTIAASGSRLRFGNWNATIESGAGAAEPGDATVILRAPNAASADGGFDAMKVVTGVFTAEEASPAAAAPIAAGESDSPLIGTLRRQDGPTGDIALHAGAITMGRRPENTIPVPLDAYISGRHAEFVADPTGVVLTDLGSTNGTVVNGQKLAPNEPCRLQAGDEVRIGQCMYVFEPAGNGPAEAEPDAAINAEGAGQYEPPTASAEESAPEA